MSDRFTSDEVAKAGNSQELARRISREEQGGSPHSFLSRTSRLLASSLDYETTLRSVAGLALPYLGAWAIVDVVEGYEKEGEESRMRRVAVVHPDPEKREIATRLEESWPPEREDPIGAPVVLRTRESEVITRASEEMLSQVARSDENLRDLRALGMGSVLVVPMMARDRVVGAVTFISPREGEEYADTHLELAEDLAARCAVAIDNAVHYRQASRARQAAEARAKSERAARQYAEDVVDTMREPLLILDEDLRVLTANRSFYRSFRSTPEEVEGRFVYEMAGGRWDIPRLRELLEEVLPANTSFEEFEVEQEFDGLGPRTLLLNARGVHRGEEGTRCILVAMEDVTERRRGEKDREDLLQRERVAREEAENAVRARQQMLAIVSHDLRSPLNVISSSAHLLLALPAEARRQKEEERLAAIIRSADRMNRLIADLLDVSRIEAGKFPVHRASLDVGPLLDEAGRAFRERAGKESVELEWKVEEALPHVAADRDRILRVLENLLSNAIKYTPEGGRVEMRAEGGEQDVVVSVTDSGPGIPEPDRAHLFAPFWRAGDAGDDGAGLGLFISRGIIEAHDGRIWVESETGEGSTFRFTLPVDGTA